MCKIWGNIKYRGVDSPGGDNDDVGHTGCRHVSWKLNVNR